MIKVKPVQGAVVRDPETKKLLAASGEMKPQNSYWLRRLRDGDVEEVKPLKGAKK